jgi:hypothetical protein
MRERFAGPGEKDAEHVHGQLLRARRINGGDVTGMTSGRRPLAGALLIAGGLCASSCGDTGSADGQAAQRSDVDVVVSLYSGLENPTIRVPGSEYDSILQCLTEADPEGDVTGAYGIPAFAIAHGDVTFYVQEDGVVEEAPRGTAALEGCGDAFDALVALSDGQLTEEELELLEGG